jgi:hypothetical protein
VSEKTVAELSVEAGQAFYSEDQPRDENGRWGGGSEAGKAAAESARTPAEHNAAAAYHSAAVAHHIANQMNRGDAPYANHTAESAHTIAAAAHTQAAKSGGSGKGAPSYDTRFAREASADAHIASHNAMRESTGRQPNVYAHEARARGMSPAALAKANAYPTHGGGAAKSAERSVPLRYRVGKHSVGELSIEAAEALRVAPDDSLEGKARELARAVFYSPDQERDANGKWGGGSATGQRAEHAITYGDHTSARDYHHKAAAALDRKGFHKAATTHRDAADAHGAAHLGHVESRMAREASVRAHNQTRNSVLV